MIELVIQAAFGLFSLGLAVGFGRRWRRQARARGAGARTPAEWLISFNAVGSVLFGLALLWTPVTEAWSQWEQWLTLERLQGLPVTCDRQHLALRNQSGGPRRITLSGLSFESSAGRLMEEPRAWPSGAPEASRLLGPGESLQVALAAPDAGPCGPPGPFALDVATDLPWTDRCVGLRAHLRSERGDALELDLPVRCAFK